jgi:succinate dehydrogenase/fumarate reductase flavoprotein subunit
MRYEEYVYRSLPKWPYTVDYTKETEVTCDVLVLGGGIAGGHAAYTAARAGAKVAVVDKGNFLTSGCGGSGVDHWQLTITHPACTWAKAPLEAYKLLMDNFNQNHNAIPLFIKCNESWPILQQCEQLGMKIRDSEDEFKGAPFRDEKTKVMFAYDYKNKYTARVFGWNHKQVVYNECKRLGVNIFDRVFVTSLITEGGKQGNAVVGATAFNTLTGEFYVFRAKATVLSMAFNQRTHTFNTELNGVRVNWRPPNMTGDGHAMAYRAGAMVVAADQLGGPTGAGFGLPTYGTGQAANTWFGAPMVDANGKVIPFVDKNGNILAKFEDRFLPPAGAIVQFDGGGVAGPNPKYRPNGPMRITEKNAKDFVRPFYADLSLMPEKERRSLFGHMVGQEGRTLIPIYFNYTRAGFDPDKDLLQAYAGDWMGQGPPNWLVNEGGGLYTDWDLMTSLSRLFAAGWQVFKVGTHANASVSGSYAGNHAARFAKGATLPSINRAQVDAEKVRVYAPLLRKNGIGWKDLNSGICRVNQDYCTRDKLPNLLNLGLRWFDELLEAEAITVMARNPRELMRVHEMYNIITNSQMIMKACLAPTKDNNWVTIKQVGGDAKVGLLDYNYAGDVEKNYNAHKLPYAKA